MQVVATLMVLLSVATVLRYTVHRRRRADPAYIAQMERELGIASLDPMPVPTIKTIDYLGDLTYANSLPYDIRHYEYVRYGRRFAPAPRDRLDERQAAIDLFRATTDLSHTLADPGATKEEREQARIDFEQTGFTRMAELLERAKKLEPGVDHSKMEIVIDVDGSAHYQEIKEGEDE